MVLTRAEAKTAFNHVLDTVLGRADKSPLKSALVDAGIDDMFHLTTITDTIIDSLVYEDEKTPGTKVSVRSGDKNLVRCFLHYIAYCNNNNQPIGDGWTSVTAENFDQFRISQNFVVTSNVSPSNQPNKSSSTSTTSQYSPADLFRRGIKRDQSLFPTLKDERFNDQWHRSFVNQARAQDVSEVLDSNYKPTTPDEKDLFIEKQKYVFAVLESKVLTDKGKSIVRQYEATFDAQLAYKGLVDHHLKSTKAMIDSASILSYITSSKIGQSDWQGTAESYIINWQNQVRLYERQVPESDHFSDLQKRIMLQNAVNDIEELRQVKNTAELLKVNSGKDITYEEYASLLHSAAVAYDSQFKTKKKHRQVFQHDLLEVDDPYGEGFEPFDIDTPIDTIQAFSTTSSSAPNNKPKINTYTKQRVMMPQEKWYRLNQKQKALWDQLDDTAKSIILGYDKPSSEKQFDAGGADKSSMVNLHAISAYDYIQANMHDLEITDGVNGDNNANGHDPPADCNDTKLINATKAPGNKSKFPPGDIRRVLSKSSKRLADSGTKDNG